MKHPACLVAVAVAAASIAAVQSVPSELSALAAKARLGRPVAAWYRGKFRPGHPGEFAVAITFAGSGGRYVVLESDATVVELGSFARGDCLTAAAAELQ
jgi:hypothetical protein